MVTLSLNVTTALNYSFASICEVNKGTIIAVDIQFAVLAVGGYNTPGGLSYFGQNTCPEEGEQSHPNGWGSLAAAQACFYLSR